MHFLVITSLVVAVSDFFRNFNKSNVNNYEPYHVKGVLEEYKNNNNKYQLYYK